VRGHGLAVRPVADAWATALEQDGIGPRRAGLVRHGVPVATVVLPLLVFPWSIVSTGRKGAARFVAHMVSGATRVLVRSSIGQTIGDTIPGVRLKAASDAPAASIPSEAGTLPVRANILLTATSRYVWTLATTLASACANSPALRIAADVLRGLAHPRAWSADVAKAALKQRALDPDQPPRAADFETRHPVPAQ